MDCVFMIKYVPCLIPLSKYFHKCCDHLNLDHIYIVLDALDEFTVVTGLTPYTGLTFWHTLAIKSLGSNIHLLVTSRDISKIGLLFKKDARLDI
ncbi:hypothetical protein ARMGADRAFT_1130343 [Armillaria gallica]|uniref:Uncharacterized protein n=1 Tax=Armillaria gallica TaxID=47427 RepID=A0A2H3DSY2_ARMGA|nr:hypothetical protein ARMGADRAFT_1130343 [Armillaria gallica]